MSFVGWKVAGDGNEASPVLHSRKGIRVASVELGYAYEWRIIVPYVLAGRSRVHIQRSCEQPNH